MIDTLTGENRLNLKQRYDGIYSRLSQKKSPYERMQLLVEEFKRPKGLELFLEYLLSDEVSPKTISDPSRKDVLTAACDAFIDRAIGAGYTASRIQVWRNKFYKVIGIDLEGLAIK